MKSLIFDMDGLLIDSEGTYQANWNKLAIQYNVDLPLEFYQKIVGSGGEATRRVIREYFNTNDPDELIKTVFKNSREELLKDVPVKPGVYEILEYCSSNGYVLSVASSQERELIYGYLDKMDITKYFDYITGLDEVSIGKPDPEIFNKAIAKTKIDPKDTYIFEDSYNGIIAASKAHSNPIMIPDRIMPNNEIKQLCKVYSSLLDALEDIKIQKL